MGRALDVAPGSEGTFAESMAAVRRRAATSCGPGLMPQPGTLNEARQVGVKKRGAPPASLRAEPTIAVVGEETAVPMDISWW